VLVDPDGEAVLSALDTELSGAPVDYAQLVHDCKREVTDGILGSEVARLVRVIGELPGVAREQQTEALAELLASFPVYRSYLPDGREHLDATVAAVRARRPDLTAALDALHPVLSQAGTEAATRFEQTSGPVMAKGVEDSAYYRWARFVMLNEVGGDPARFGSTVAEFHEAQQRRVERKSESMTALSTHDTKRSEDTRARLAVLAELGAEWADLVRGLLTRHPLPDRPLAHLVWQNLVGAWPLSRERAHGYAEKAAREAGTSTTWTDVDEEFETALHAMVDAAFDDERTHAELERFVARIAPFGRSNSLAQKLLQLTMPGVPDVYQGTELWDLSLVDPDNRRPVDYDLRRRLLAQLDGGEVPAVDETGAAKLLVVSRVLRARREHPEWFAGYEPVTAPASPPTTWWPSTAVAWWRWRPGCRSACRSPVGATPRCGCRPGPGATCSPAAGSSPTPRGCRWPGCSSGSRSPCSSATEREPPFSPRLAGSARAPGGRPFQHLTGLAASLWTGPGRSGTQVTSPRAHARPRGT
jgi:(1->4)-alpha-D-glucan 1-alpha-D-glucosylmutase